MKSNSDSRTGSVLITLLDNFSEDAWCAFVDRYTPKIYGWCRKWDLQEADAQDVTQEVLTKLVQNLRSFRYDPKKGTFRGWLRSVTKRAWLDYRHAQRRDTDVLKRLHAREAREDLVQALEEEFDLEVYEKAKEQVWQQISARDRRIFEELAVARRNCREVAKSLDMKVAAVLMVKGRVQRRLSEAVRRLEGVVADL